MVACDYNPVTVASRSEAKTNKPGELTRRLRANWSTYTKQEEQAGPASTRIKKRADYRKLYPDFHAHAIASIYPNS